jgi:hypothetical protein
VRDGTHERERETAAAGRRMEVTSKCPAARDRRRRWRRRRPIARLRGDLGNF